MHPSLSCSSPAPTHCCATRRPTLRTEPVHPIRQDQKHYSALHAGWVGWSDRKEQAALLLVAFSPRSGSELSLSLLSLLCSARSVGCDRFCLSHSLSASVCHQTCTAVPSGRSRSQQRQCFFAPTQLEKHHLCCAGWHSLSFSASESVAANQ